MNGHLERKRFINCFIESGKVYINQNAGKFMISEEFDQEGFSRSILFYQISQSSFSLDDSKHNTINIGKSHQIPIFEALLSII